MEQTNYDIFISCKSEDYAKATPIFYWLIEEGFNPFFAPISLKISKIHGEPVVFGDEIDEALEQADNMIIFTSNSHYVKTGYVKDEWRTFVEEQRSGRKHGSLVTILDGVVVADLPIRLRSVQSFTLSNYKNGIIRFMFTNKAIDQEESEAHRIANERSLAEEKRIAEEKRLFEGRRREEEWKAEEKRKYRDEEEWTKEKTFNVGGVLFKMIHVEGGSFMMGSPNNNSDAYCEKKSRHRVTLSDYYIGETLVTLALWKAVMGNFPITPKGDNLPVEKVSWIDCRNFINRLNKKLGDQILNGNRFCLPTEAQWEYAARGGNKAHDYIYAGSNNIEDVAWYGKNSSGNTRPVKTKLCNELGLYDMSGNVWEWCQNRQDDYKRVLCGGSWISDANNCLVDSRSYYSPDSRYIGIGFRLALVHQ